MITMVKEKEKSVNSWFYLQSTNASKQYLNRKMAEQQTDANQHEKNVFIQHAI